MKVYIIIRSLSIVFNYTILAAVQITELLYDHEIYYILQIPFYIFI